MEIVWEQLEDKSTNHFTTHRAKVFGGWLFRTYDHWLDDVFGCQSEALVFVPDSKHEWIVQEQCKHESDGMVCISPKSECKKCGELY